MLTRALLGQRDRFFQHADIADVIGEDQHQLRIERRRRLFAESPCAPRPA